MHLAALVLVSYAIASTGSPLSDGSQSIQGDNNSLDAPATVERDIDLSLGQRAWKRADKIYTALGTFGPKSLLGSIDKSGNGVAAPATSNGDDQPIPPFICIGKCGAAAAFYLFAAGLQSTITFLKRLLSFHNNDADWPMYPDGDVLWSVRTFRTTQCGRTGVRDGIDPTASDHTGPYMMSEYKSSNLNYHDNQPCENFMFADPRHIGGVGVGSVAVWLHPSVTDGYIFAYTNPVCDATLVNGKTAQQFTSEASDLVAIYNGTGALFQGDKTASTVEPGVWACLSAPGATWNGFSVIQIGKTDMTVPADYYQKGHIPGPATQPKFRFLGLDALVSKNAAWGVNSSSQVGPAPYNRLADPETYSIGETLGY